MVSVFSFGISDELDLKLRVAVWENRTGYDRNKRWAGTHAYYQQPSIRLKHIPWFVTDGGDVETMLACNQKTYGTIHLVQGEFDIGDFAHELTHFALSFRDLLRGLGGYKESDVDEYVCAVVGSVTSEFWIWLMEGGKDE